MEIDVSKIVIMIDYFTRLINDLINQVLVMFGMSPLTENSYEFSTAKDILNPNPNGVINR